MLGKGQTYRLGVQEGECGIWQPVLLPVGLGGKLLNLTICHRYQGTIRQS
jgi:hypothetical protein